MELRDILKSMRKEANMTRRILQSILVFLYVVGSKNTKYSNPKKVTIKSDKTVNLKVGKTFRYSSSDTSVAKVSLNGKITAVGKGTCTVYVYARNGYAAKIKVTVK